MNKRQAKKQAKAPASVSVVPATMEMVRNTPSPVIEICRSFSYKLNCGNYESRDFFMSQKAECTLETLEITSEAIYQFCKNQVLKAVRGYGEEMRQGEHK